MRVVMAALVWLLLSAPASAQALEAEVFVPKDGPGLGVIAGFGYQFAGLGVAASYYQPVRQSGFTVVPHVGVGGLVVDMALNRYRSAPSRDTRIPVGVNGGVSVTYGAESRA